MFSTLCLGWLQPSIAEEPVPAEPVIDGPSAVYVIPITDAINKPNLYVLRRGLKEAIANKAEMVILDMDTPGGRVDYTLEMMEMLNRFDGLTATYVNDDAISAGSFIAAATREIYFSPRGKMGASAVIQGTGGDVPETARQKIESYLRANIRVMTEDYPYRSDVIRAMLDAEFELKVGDEVIKPKGELLTLTAKEAMQEYGDPPQPLLGAGIYDSLNELLDARFGEGNYVISDFHISYSEDIAKWMNTFAPALLGLGMLALFIEFKTPGFGIFGIAGILLLGIFFISNYIAGLAGNEVIVVFALGILLVLIEILFFPGTLVFGISGICMIFGSLLWAMVDYWPDQGFEINGDMLAQPLVNLVLGMGIAVFGALLIWRFLPGSFLERSIVLTSAAGGSSEAVHELRESVWPRAGEIGLAVTALHPGGRVEFKGRRYEARSQVGAIDRGAKVRVVQSGDFGLVVEEVSE
ncbi:NfeD family protein [Coraliomargarita parva]|uniref:NfeD family protein n=1 Tax=Coraliomargarita parva TaxID=3014050 RepID=UPI0022B53673|nr:NfeD family protein [Coraliomargarita parva]